MQQDGAFTVNVLFPTPGGMPPGGGGCYAWGTTTSSNPLTVWNGTITGGGVVTPAPPCAPNTWALRIDNGFNGGNNVTLTVGVEDNQGNTGTATVTFKFAAF